VQAALTVFSLKGYAAASMDDVCLAAGVSKGGLYHHFPTKRALLSSVLQRVVREGGLRRPASSDDAAISHPEAPLGRIVLEIWAEAARDGELRGQLLDGYVAQTAGVEEGVVWSLADVLRAGGLIALLTRGGVPDAERAARRLGIERAA
jgi:AcrR family transcriptional regulator